MFGEMANVLLEGSRVSSQKLNTNGFQYQFPGLDKTLKHIVSIK
jgi:NAD dependent epimerase/dehydratase family enzyme